jgi:hypothetical protein
MNSKEATAKKEEELAELLTIAEGHPMMKAILAEKTAEVLAKRTEAAGKIEAMKKEREEVIPKLIEARDVKEAKYKEAKAALDAAGVEYQTARVAVSSRSQAFDSSIGQQEVIIFGSADARIDEAITFFRGKLDWLRAPGRISIDHRGGENNPFTEKTTLKVESNRPAILAALQYCMAAIKELEQMKLTPALNLQKIDGMKTALPKIDVYTEFTGEKPYGFTIANVNPRLLLPSDSQMDWEIGKLKEKVKKVLGR